ncbi:MAG: arsenosugar biosynthesis-associated peroxidase-like protein [Planctomycetes bacterium]|nr:arsenosugar biosynthesis-associated peroxidase-like protein [Planctomycetota bacterium]
MSRPYFDPRHLEHFEQVGAHRPELARKFFDYYAAVFGEGALPAREKALIALAVAHAVQCPYCIEAYARESLEKGADAAQMTEAVHVATAIRGGATLVHAMQMRDHVERLGM